MRYRIEIVWCWSSLKAWRGKGVSRCAFVSESVQMIGHGKCRPFYGCSTGNPFASSIVARDHAGIQSRGFPGYFDPFDNLIILKEPQCTSRHN